MSLDASPIELATCSLCRWSVTKLPCPSDDYDVLVHPGDPWEDVQLLTATEFTGPVRALWQHHEDRHPVRYWPTLRP